MKYRATCGSVYHDLYADDEKQATHMAVAYFGCEHHEVLVDDFYTVVARAVARDYGLLDGGSLAFNLVEQGVIGDNDDFSSAAAVVAQHMEQA